MRAASAMRRCAPRPSVRVVVPIRTFTSSPLQRATPSLPLMRSSLPRLASMAARPIVPRITMPPSRLNSTMTLDFPELKDEEFNPNQPSPHRVQFSANELEQREKSVREKASDPNSGDRGVEVARLIKDLAHNGQLEKAMDLLSFVVDTTRWSVPVSAFGTVLHFQLHASNLDKNDALPPALLLMRRLNIPCDLTVLNAVQRLCITETRPDLAERVLRWLPTHIIGERHFSVLIKTYFHMNSKDAISRLLEYMKDARKTPHMYTLRIGTLIRLGRIQEAFDMLQEMRGAFCLPTDVTYNTFFIGFSKMHVITPEHIEWTRKLREEMRVDNIPMNSIMTDCLIRVFTAASPNYYGHAKAAYKQALEEGVVPDVVLLSTLISAAIGAGEWKEVDEWLAEMKSRGLPPDGRLYTNIINRAAQANNLAIAAKYRELRDKAGLQMNDLDRSAAFSGVLQGGRRTPRTMGIALTQLRGEESEQMKAAVAAELAEQKKHSTTHSSWTPAEVGKKDTWSTRRTEEMERLRVETEATLVEQGVNARSAMQNYNTLVKHTTRTFGAKKALELVERLRAAEFRPDLFTYTILLQSVARERMNDQVQSLWDEMIKAGYKPNRYTHIGLCISYASVGNAEGAEKHAQELEKIGEKVDASLCNTMVGMYSSFAAAKQSDRREYWLERREAEEKKMKEMLGQNYKPVYGSKRPVKFAHHHNE